MKTLEISKQVVMEGLLAGAVVIKLTILSPDSKEGIERSLDDAITILLEQSKLGLIYIEGKLSENPEIKPLVTGLVEKGKRVTLRTTSDEDLAPLGVLQNFRVVLISDVPNKKVNNLVMSNLMLLREDDELWFTVDSTKHYDDLLVFLEGVLITRPVVYVDIRNIELGKQRDKLIQRYLEDCENFKFRNRIMI